MWQADALLSRWCRSDGKKNSNLERKKEKAGKKRRIDDASSHIKHFMSVLLSKGKRNWGRWRRRRNKTKKSTDQTKFHKHFLKRAAETCLDLDPIIDEKYT